MLSLRIHAPANGAPSAPTPLTPPNPPAPAPASSPNPPPAVPPEPVPPAPTTPTPTRPPAATPRFPRKLSVLSVSWLSGRLEAVAIHRGNVVGTWQRPEPCDEPGRFAELLKEAATRTGFTGSSVTLVLSHPRLTHQLVETPPAKGPALAALVRRQIERLKVFEGEPALAFQRALPTKNSQSVLVHLFPRNLLDLLVAGAERAGFHLTSIVPPTAILHGQLGRLGLQPDEIALIAADTGATSTILVGKPDGQLMLGRSVDASSHQAGGNLGVELSRTLLFGSQQFGLSVGSIWLFGPALAPRLAELQSQLQVPVRLSPQDLHPFYWAFEAARLPAGQTPNLVSTEQQKAPQRRVLLVAATAVALVLLLAAGATATVCHLLVLRERARIGALETQIATLNGQHQELQRAHLELDRKAELVQSVLDDRPAPIPAWFLSYLGEAVPPELLLTNCIVRRDGPQWRLHLSGILQPSTNPVPVAVLTNHVEVLAQRLRNGPFHVDLTPPAPPANTPATPTPPRSAFGAIASWASRFAAAGTEVPPPPTDYFVLEGSMQ